MTVPLPDPLALRAIRDQIWAAWPDEPPPTASEALEHRPPDSEGVERYFAGRHVRDVDPFCSEISQEFPFLSMTPIGVHYYLPAYLAYLVDERHLASRLVGDTPAVHVLRHLTRKLKAPEMALYSAGQIEAILAVLGLVRRHAGFYCIGEAKDARALEHGIRRWERLLRVRRQAGKT
jgi:hypothetical protein